MIHEMREVVTIIIRELFARFDVSKRENPDMAPNNFSFAVRLARVVNKTSIVFRNIAIDVVTLVELENIDKTLALFSSIIFPGNSTALGFRLGNFLTQVFDNTCALRDVYCGK